MTKDRLFFTMVGIFLLMGAVLLYIDLTSKLPDKERGQSPLNFLNQLVSAQENGLKEPVKQAPVEEKNKSSEFSDPKEQAKLMELLARVQLDGDERNGVSLMDGQVAISGKAIAQDFSTDSQEEDNPRTHIELGENGLNGNKRPSVEKKVIEAVEATAMERTSELIGAQDIVSRFYDNMEDEQIELWVAELQGCITDFFQYGEELEQDSDDDNAAHGALRYRLDLPQVEFENFQECVVSGPYQLIFDEQSVPAQFRLIAKD